MTVISEQDLPALLKAGAPSSNGIVLFGTDPSGIAALLRSIILKFASDEEPLRIEASSLRGDPRMLDDAFRAMSLLGDRRLIVVDGCEEAHANALLPVMEFAAIGNFVVLVCGSLNKASKLRAAATSSQRFHAMAVYEETNQALLLRIQRKVAETGVSFGNDAAERFLELCGADRSQVDSELEKLSLYCWPAKAISLLDVEQSCGDQASFDSDTLTAHVLDGELDACDRAFESMRAGGEWRQALVMLQMQVVRLENLRAALDQGMDQDQAFRSAKPPIFFAQQKSVARHLRMLSSADLARTQAAIQTATLASRQSADLAEAITSRALLSIARMMRQLRSRKLG